MEARSKGLCSFYDLVKGLSSQNQTGMAGRFFTTSTTWETQAWKQQIVASRDCLLLLKGWGHWTCWTVFRTIEAHWATLSGLLSRVWQNLFKARNADRHISALSPIPRLSPFSVLLLQSTQSQENSPSGIYSLVISFDLFQTF